MLDLAQEIVGKISALGELYIVLAENEVIRCDEKNKSAGTSGK
jgi:hypothetical protein